MIKILSLYIDNFFSFKNQTDIPALAGISSFIGVNNAGKSNILRTMQWYKNLLKNNYASLNTLHNYHKKNKDNLFDFAIELGFYSHFVAETAYEFNNVEMTHFLRFDSKGELVVEKFSIKKPNQEPITLLYKYNLEEEPKAYFQSDDNLHYYLYGAERIKIPIDFRTLSAIKLNNYGPFRWQGIGEQIGEISKTLLQELRDYINDWFFFDSTRFIDSNLNSNVSANYDSILEDNAEFSSEEMDPRGNNTSKFLELKHSDKPEETIKAMDLITKVFDLKRIRSTRNTEWPRKISTFSKDKNDIESPFDLMGSGYQQVLIIASNILLKKNNTVFFIEEPELHLHPRAQREFLKIMGKGVREFEHQFLITTHSSIFSLIRRNEFHTFLVTKNEDSSSIRILTKEDLQEVKDILGYKNSDIFGYDAILLVEGHTEENILPLLSEIMKIDILDNGIGIFNSKSYGNMTQIGNLINMLESTGTKVYALYDDHEGQQKKLKDIEEQIPESKRIKLNRSFENCFSKDVLIESLKNLIELKETEYSTKYQKLTKYRDLELLLKKEFSDPFRYISQYYYNITGREINKVEYGIQIVASIRARLNSLTGNEKDEYLSNLLNLGPFNILENIRKDLTVNL